MLSSLLEAFVEDLWLFDQLLAAHAIRRVVIVETAFLKALLLGRLGFISLFLRRFFWRIWLRLWFIHLFFAVLLFDFIEVCPVFDGVNLSFSHLCLLLRIKNPPILFLDEVFDRPQV